MVSKPKLLFVFYLNDKRFWNVPNTTFKGVNGAYYLKGQFMVSKPKLLFAYNLLPKKQVF